MMDDFKVPGFFKFAWIASGLFSLAVLGLLIFGGVKACNYITSGKAAQDATQIVHGEK